MIDSSEFRRVVGHFPTGVAIVSTLDAAGRPCGLTVNAFCSVSLDPQLVLVCVERNADSHECIQHSGFFAVNVLSQHLGEVLSRRFATWEVHDKFEGVAYRGERSGAPVLEEAMAWLDCDVTQAVPAGDHTIFIGEVMAADAKEGIPLTYYRGGYGRFTS
ncbi:MAG TPA: flavin reductase family protein [Longimicrobiaceae bacterium]|nr:flavin reductase family protein [Longimicrobiaceae bacterium]